MGISALCVPLSAEEPAKGHRYIGTTFSQNKMFVMGADGKIEWQMPVPDCFDVWQLPNSNFLVVSRAKGILEIDKDKNIVWSYKPLKETYGAQRLANGNTVIGDNDNFRVIEVDKDGKIQHEVKIETKSSAHGGMRQVRKLASGNYLLSQRYDSVVREYDPSGKVVWEYKIMGGGMSAVRLPNGNTLMASGGGYVVEVDKDLKEVWRFDRKEIPAELQGKGGRGYGVQRLPNGNTVAAFEGAIYEITPDKKIVWHQKGDDIKMLMNFQILDVPGDALKGEVHR
jgi:outer membrane protein assembly factor BamB